MANVFKYLTGNPSRRALKKGNLARGIGGEAYGPTSQTGYYAGVTPPNGGYVVASLNGSNLPEYRIANNDNDLIQIARDLGGNPTNTSTAKTYLSGRNNTWVYNDGAENIVTNGLVFYVNASSITSYPESGTVWKDLSGSGYDLTLTNGPIWNSKGYFDNDGDSYFIGNGGSKIPTGNDPYTMVVIARQVGSWGNADGFISIGGFYSTNQSNALRTLSNTVGTFHHYWWGNDLSLSNNNAGLALGKWFMVAASFDGTTRRIWVNGVSRASAGASGHNVTSTTIQVSKTVASEYQVGDIAEASIYDRALSSDEMLQLYHKGNPITNGLILSLDADNLISYEPNSTSIYSLVDSHTGTLVNGPTTGANYISFDGVNDRIDISSSPFAPGTWNHNEVTAIAFIRPSSKGAGDNNIWTIENSWEIAYQSNGTLQFASNPWAWRSVSGVVTMDQWQMITYRHNTSTLKGELFVNNNKVFSYTIGGNLNAGNGYDTFRIMARHCCGGSHAKGDLGLTYIYNRSLSDEEITSIFNAQKGRFGI
jgi:hypothetical protein